MSDSKLEVLKQKRDDILRAEIAALLHDVGKFCDLHIEHVSGGRKWSNDDAYKAIVDNPGGFIRLSKSAANIKKPDVVNNVLNAQSPKAADFITPAVKDLLDKTHVTILDQDYALAELIMLGMPGFATHQNRDQLLEGKDGWLPALLGVCHNEAHVDKEEPVGGQQALPHILTSNAFGFETRAFVLGDAQDSLDAHLNLLPIDSATMSARETQDKIAQEFERGLGDTRRPINEVTLADWSEIVAALFKSAVAGTVLSSVKSGIRQWRSWKDKIIDHDLHWRVLRVNFDELGLYAKAIKIADLLSYQRAVKDACAAVKRLVEEEYPLGNEIYRDTTGIYFTFPDIDLPAELAQEIRRRVEEVEPELAPRVSVGSSAPLKTLLSNSHEQARTELAYPITLENLNPRWQAQWETVGEGKWELCPVCRLRPMKEGKEACETCDKRRDSRIATWLAKPHETIWMDEITDTNDRVALIVGKFGLDGWLSGDLVQTMLVKAVENNPSACKPKNPSPARLRRVWETTERFWKETVEKILAELPARTRWELEPATSSPDKMPPKQIVCDGTLNGQPISVFRIGGRLLIISFGAQLHAGNLNISWEEDRRKQQTTLSVVSVKKAESELAKYQTYAPHLTLHTSPDQFLALAPASDALNIASNIHDEYQKQFGKVQNRLPLFLGIVFFQRKMPLAAVMDTAQRMLETKVDSEQWTVKQFVNDTLTFENGVAWHVPATMGDGKTPDVWYPYYKVKGGLGSPKLHFTLGTDNWVHVSEIEGKQVSVTPSRFAYVFLESTAQHFEFDASEDKDGMRLDELPALMEMWEKLKDWANKRDGSDTALRGVQALLETKAAAWGATSLELKQLADTTLKHAKLFKRKDKNGNPLADIVTPNDVTSGRFARCLELHTKILKLKLEGKNEQPTV